MEHEPRLFSSVYENVDNCLSIIECRGKIDIENPTNGLTPLIFAIQTQNFEVANLLLDRGADVSVRGAFECNCLIVACRLQESDESLNLIQKILDLTPVGVDLINMRDIDLYPLSIAGLNHNLRVVNLLIQNRVNPLLLNMCGFPGLENGANCAQLLRANSLALGNNFDDVLPTIESYTALYSTHLRMVNQPFSVLRYETLSLSIRGSPFRVQMANFFIVRQRTAIFTLLLVGSRLENQEDLAIVEGREPVLPSIPDELLIFLLQMINYRNIGGHQGGGKKTLTKNQKNKISELYLGQKELIDEISLLKEKDDFTNTKIARILGIKGQELDLLIYTFESIKPDKCKPFIGKILENIKSQLKRKRMNVNKLSSRKKSSKKVSSRKLRPSKSISRKSNSAKSSSRK